MTTQQQPQSLASMWEYSSPEELTAREMFNQYTMRPDQDVGFFSKVGTAFTNETVTGEILRELTAPDYDPTDYVANDEDREKYAGDLPSEIVDRIADKSKSFAEFLWEVDEVRLTNKRRAELFSGGVTGAIEGMGLTLLAAGGEAVLLTALASAIGGPAGGAAAVGSAVSKATRIRGALKGLGIAAAVDTPLEIARYNLDNTMRPQDAMIAIGAAAGIGGGLGAWKPHLFLKSAKSMGETAKKVEKADALEAAGKTKEAADIRDGIKAKTKIRPVSEVREEIDALKGQALKDRAKELEIELRTTNEAGKRVNKKVAQLREEIFKKTREAEGADVRSIVRQVNKDLEGLNVSQRAEYARNLGVKESVIKKGGKDLRKSIHRQAQKVARTGVVKKGEIPKLPKGLGKGLKNSATFKKVKIKFKSRVESALWVIGKASPKNADRIKELKAWFKASGIDDVDALAKQFVKDAQDMAGKSKSTDVDLDVRGMGVGGTKVRGGEALEEGQGLFETRVSQRFEVDDPHPISDSSSTTIRDTDGNPIVDIDEEWSKFIDLDEDTLAAMSPGRYSIFGHGKGFREALGRFLDTLGGFENVPIIGFFAKHTMPLQIRLSRYNSPLARKFASVFLEGPRSGGNNVATAAKTNREAVLSRVYDGLRKAFEDARKQGIKIEELEIIRGVRSGATPPGPLGDAIKAVREFHTELLAHAKKNGIFTDAIPDSSTYFHRAYNSASFVKMIEKHGEDAVIDFFKKSVLAKTPKIGDSKAKKLAKRIVEYGRDPEGARDAKTGEIRIDSIRTKIAEDFHGKPYDKLSDAEKAEVEKFVEAVVPSIERQPHMSYGKRRIELDETFEASIGGEAVHIDNFFNNDLHGSLHRYAGRITGGVEIRKGFKALFGKADITLADAQAMIRKDLVDYGKGDNQAFLSWAVDHQFKSMAHLPIYDSPETMKWIVGANSFAQATIGQTLGFAQLPEIASVLCRNGFRAAYTQFPALSDILKIFTMGPRDLLTGRKGLGLEGLKHDDLASTLETFIGIGAGDYRRGDHFMRRLDELGLDDDLVKGSVNKFLDYGRVTAGMNPLGIMPMDTFLRRWAAKSSFQHFWNQAYSLKGGKPVLNKGFWNNSSARFGELGLDADMIQRINKTLMDPKVVGVERGMFGSYEVKTLNMENVTDKYAMDQLFLAIRRHTDSMVQRQSFGETPAWMSKPLGKLFAQYRVFSFAAKSKQAAAGMARGDGREAVNVIMGGSLGALAYTLQSHYRAAGMDEYDKTLYLGERMTHEKVIKAGALKYGGSSIFPMIADSGAWLFGKEPFFDPSMRTTGLGVDPLTGSVPYSILYGKVKPAFREITGEMFRDDPVSKKDMRNMKSLIWGLQIPGVDQAVNLWINDTSLREKD